MESVKRHKYYYNGVFWGMYHENIRLSRRKEMISERKQRGDRSLADKFDKFDISF